MLPVLDAHWLMPTVCFSAVIIVRSCFFQWVRKEVVVIGHKFVLHQVAQLGFRDTTKQISTRLLAKIILLHNWNVTGLVAIDISENHDVSYNNQVIEN